MRHGEVVTQRTLTPLFTGSNPVAVAKSFYFITPLAIIVSTSFLIVARGFEFIKENKILLEECPSLVYGAGLENRWSSEIPGFKSQLLRQWKNGVMVSQRTANASYPTVVRVRFSVLPPVSGYSSVWQST